MQSHKNFPQKVISDENRSTSIAKLISGSNIKNVKSKPVHIINEIKERNLGAYLEH